MATAEVKEANPPWIPRQKPWPERNGVFRFTVEQTYQLHELGFFDDRRVELIEGVLYELTMLPPPPRDCDSIGLPRHSSDLQPRLPRAAPASA